MSRGRVALVAIAAGLAVAMILVTAFPSVVVGVDGRALSYSVQATDLPGRCHSEGERWQCDVWDSQMSGTVSYVLAVDDLGCWAAGRVSRGGEGSSPRELRGCITILDHIRPWDRASELVFD